MTYSRFEKLVLFFSFTAVVGTIIASFYQRTGSREIIGQFLILIVIFGALKYGIRGGFWSAVGSSFLYILIYFNLVFSKLWEEILYLAAIKVVVYFFIGMTGGIISTKIKYFFTKLEHNDYIDDQTNLYSKKYIKKLIENFLSLNERYKDPFSLALFNLNSSLVYSNKKTKDKYRLKQLGSIIRNDVRTVDEVGYLGQGQFCVIFPRTNKEGGQIATNRIWIMLKNHLNISDEEFEETNNFTLYTCPENNSELNSLEL